MSFAAWARSSGVWSGNTVIQSLSAIRHIFLTSFRDSTVFSNPTISSLRKSLRLTDRFDDARSNKDNRLPFSLDMVNSAAQEGVSSTDPNVVMLSTSIVTASILLLRIGEYATTATTAQSPDHRILSRNVAFFLTGQSTPVSPSELRAAYKHLPVSAIPTVDSVSLTLAGSKADIYHNGVTFSFEAADFDSSDQTNPISMWVRWALMAHHEVDDPFFSFRLPDNTLTLLRDTAVTQEIRRVAAMHGIPMTQLHRFTPHSIRIGMASHLHNLGFSATSILQMGRWSPRSSAAPKYQRLSAGICSRVAQATSERQSGHTAKHTIKTLIRPAGFNTQYQRRRSMQLEDSGERTAASSPSLTTRARQGQSRHQPQQSNSSSSKQRSGLRLLPVTIQTGKRGTMRKSIL